MPTPALIAIAAVAAIAVIAWLFASRGLEREVDHALATGETGPLVERILQRPAVAQPAAFNHAIRRLWNGYQRGPAVRMIRSLGELHADVPISQYWIAQALSVEPTLARDALDQRFLDAHYRPKVAATCGTAG